MAASSKPKASLPDKWAERYRIGVHDPDIGGGDNWIVPRFPDLDIDTFELVEPPIWKNPLSAPDPTRLDRLFLSEQHQGDRFGGLRTWEATVLARPEAYVTPDLMNLALQDNVVVDESKWLKAFAKDTWRVDLTSTHGDPHLRKWSVDDPIVWAELRQCIELTDRMIKMSAKGEWLSTILAFQHSIQIIPNQEIPLGDKNRVVDIYKVNKLDPKYRLTEAEVLDWLNQDDFAKSFCRFFFDAHNGFSQEGTTVGVTKLYPLRGIDGHNIVGLDVDALKTLLSTAPNRRLARVSIATTLGHEFMHSVGSWIKYRAMNQTQLENPLIDDAIMIEFFYGDEWSTELGFSWENSLFGCIVWANEQAGGRRRKWSKGGSLMYRGDEWPNFLHHHEYSWNVICPPRPSMNMYPILSLWWTSMESEEFWTGYARRFGLQALKSPKVLRTIKKMDDLVGMMHTYRARWTSDPECPQDLRQSIDQFRRLLQERRKDWDKRRPWQQDKKSQWQMTPWNDGDARRMLQDIVRQFQGPYTTRAEHRIIDELADFRFKVKWNQDQVIPRPNDIAERVFVTRWFYRAIGCLVWAALPGRHKHLSVPNTLQFKGSSWSPRVGDPNKAEVTFLTKVIQAMSWKPPTLDFLPRHMPQPYKQARKRWLARAQHCFSIYENICAVRPTNLAQSFHAELGSLTNQLSSVDEKSPACLDFKFVLPPYSERLEGSETAYGIKDLQTASNKLWENATDVPFDDTIFATFGAEVDRDMDSLPPVPVMAAVTGTTRRTQKVQYFTIGELYDYSINEKNSVVLVENEGELEVYDRQTILKAFDMTIEDLVKVVWLSVYGVKLSREYAEKFYHLNLPVRCVGRVLRWRRPEQVAMCDGKRNRPHWIIVCNNIYDITYMEFLRHEKALEKALRSTPGGNPMLNVLRAGFDIIEVVDRLKPHRIGIIPQPASRSFKTADLMVFTNDEVRWHLYKDVRMYVTIHGIVYDITEYAELHPGGIRLLEENAGHDVTSLFEEHHGKNSGRILKQMAYLRVGRVVNAHHPDQDLRPTEIRIRRKVYDIGPLKKSPRWSGLFSRLAQYVQMDATAILDNEKVDEEDENIEALIELIRMPQLVTAKIQRTPHEVPRMTHQELAEFNGNVNEEEGWYNQAFVAAGYWVYDVTAMFRFGDPALRKRVGKWLGGVVDGQSTLTWLKNTCEYRIVAKLVENKTEVSNLTKGSEEAVVWSAKEFLRPKLKFSPSPSEKQPDPPSADGIAPLSGLETEIPKISLSDNDGGKELEPESTMDLQQAVSDLMSVDSLKDQKRMSVERKRALVGRKKQLYFRRNSMRVDSANPAETTSASRIPLKQHHVRFSPEKKQANTRAVEGTVTTSSLYEARQPTRTSVKISGGKNEHKRRRVHSDQRQPAMAAIASQKPPISPSAQPFSSSHAQSTPQDNSGEITEHSSKKMKILASPEIRSTRSGIFDSGESDGLKTGSGLRISNFKRAEIQAETRKAKGKRIWEDSSL